MKTTRPALALVALALLTSGCGGSGDGDTSEPVGPTLSATSEAPAIVTLAESCQRWFDEAPVYDFSRAYYRGAVPLVQEIVGQGDADTVEAFTPVAAATQAASETLGTIDYLDDEAALDQSAADLQDACAAVGVTYTGK